MSQWHRNNPELYEQFGEPDWFYHADSGDKRPLRACAACGEPSRGHWCSNACRRAEDGLSFEEAAEMERMQEDDARDGEW